MAEPLVGVIMGSRSDWATMEGATETLDELGVVFETRVVSAHRTPDLLFEYASTAASRGLKVIIAGAGGAAHLPGMTASKTHLPVLGVPVGTLAIGRSGAVNAALLAASIVALDDAGIRERLVAFRASQTETVLAHPDPSEG